LLAVLFVLALTIVPPLAVAGEGEEGSPLIVVGSKNFTESYVLGEIVAQHLQAAGFSVERRFGLGGTLFCYRALTSGEIDVYVEYTGTLAQAVYGLGGQLDRAALNRHALRDGVEMLAPLGFNNTYALTMLSEQAAALGVRRISQIADRPELRIAVSHEFLDREDGWPGLSRAYGLAQTPIGIEHGLAYQALAEGRIDVTDAYSTDGDIERYRLVVLEDDRSFFPLYLAAPLARTDLPSSARSALSGLAGTIDASTMRRLNAEVAVTGRRFADVAQEFLAGREHGTGTGGTTAKVATTPTEAFFQRLGENTLRHLQLTFLALACASLFGIPLGILVHRSPHASRSVLYLTGLMQTIPSIALLALMIPFLGIGFLPAVVALFLYSLLPIVRNVITGLATVDPLLRRVAVAMGLTPRQQVRYLLLPMALPGVFAGVRTAAVISIGTATLAAFVGAGGLGDPIVTGLALNDTRLILEGAVPAAVLAILTEVVFESIERIAVPAHLRSAHGLE
jgi:osmoprotectant transport system permease protein